MVPAVLLVAMALLGATLGLAVHLAMAPTVLLVATALLVATLGLAVRLTVVPTALPLALAPTGPTKVVEPHHATLTLAVMGLGATPLIPPPGPRWGHLDPVVNHLTGCCGHFSP